MPLATNSDFSVRLSSLTRKRSRCGASVESIASVTSSVSSVKRSSSRGSSLENLAEHTAFTLHIGNAYSSSIQLRYFIHLKVNTIAQRCIAKVFEQQLG